MTGRTVRTSDGGTADVVYSPDDGGWYWSDWQTDDVSDLEFATADDAEANYRRWRTL